METLNLPSYDFKVRTREEKPFILDPVRRRFVPLTPEEWVRQHFVQYLISDRGVPAALVALEMPFPYQDRYYRADVVVHDRLMRPTLIAECKRPSVQVDQRTFDQIGVYNTVIRAAYLVITNGMHHYCCSVDHAGQEVEFLNEIPHFEHLS